MGGSCSTYGIDETCIQNVSYKTEGKEQRGRPSHRWGDNVRIILRGVRWEVLDWVHRDQWGGGGSCERGNEYSVSVNDEEFLD